MLSDHVDQVSAHVARILREAREKRGLSMTVLAQRAGLSQGMVSLFESGQRNASLETLVRIAYVLEIDLGEVIQRATRSASRKKLTVHAFNVSMYSSTLRPTPPPARRGNELLELLWADFGQALAGFENKQEIICRDHQLLRALPQGR